MLAPWKKGYDKPRQHIKNERHHFANKGPNIQSWFFPVVMYGCESWTVKKAEHWKLMLLNCDIGEDSFECKEIKPVIIKEINAEYLLEGLMLKLKCQYFGSLMQSPDSLKTTLTLGKIEGRRWGDDRGWDSWVASLTQRTWVWANFGDSERQGSLTCYSPWVTKSGTWLSY